ncbi:hypothetical protein [Maridesulfovibrio sp. FT414]|uniref:hypothetical protein n=1 Tax=Maridesulfovibrio sp. FT414 TaxID=2979469 RepID=UPI003D8009D6
MKKILFFLIILPILAACAKAEHYSTPFDTGGRVYRVVLMPWHTTTMTFDFKYRWEMTQALRDACRQSGAFDFAWSAYPVNGGGVELLQDISTEGLWVRQKYGKYVPDVEKVRGAVSSIGADLALLYDISADNSAATDEDSMNFNADSIRLFLVDLKSEDVTVEFIGTNFLRKQAYGDIKRVTLRGFNKWLSSQK